MSTNYAGASSFPTLIQMPSDGDIEDAASVLPGLQGLADRTQYLSVAATFLAALLGGTSSPLQRIGVLEILSGGRIDFDGGAELRLKNLSQLNLLSGAAMNLLLGAAVTWAKGSLPVIQTLVDINAASGGPAGAVVSHNANILIAGPDFVGDTVGGFLIGAGANAGNGTAFVNTGTFVDTGPDSGYLDTQAGGVDADHVYVVGASWVTKIWAASNTAPRKYGISHTNAVQGRKCIVTFGDIAGATGTSLEIRDGSLVGPVLITLVAGTGYMSAELTYTGSAWYVSHPGVRL